MFRPVHCGALTGWLLGTMRFMRRLQIFADLRRHLVFFLYFLTDLLIRNIFFLTNAHFSRGTFSALSAKYHTTSLTSSPLLFHPRFAERHLQHPSL